MDVHSVTRADQIIELVGLNPRGISHKDLHRVLALPKSSLSRLLATLVRLQYLVFDPDSRKYQLGSRNLVLAGRYLSGLSVFQVGREFMTKVSKLTGESATLAIPAGNEAILIAIENVPQAILSPPHVGDRIPLYATAAGKAILAFQTDREIDDYFERTDLVPLTTHTIVDKDLIRRQLEDIRRGRLAHSREEFREYVVALGRPVFGVNGRVAASLSLSLLSLHVTPEAIDRMEKALNEVVSEFSRRLGYDGKEW